MNELSPEDLKKLEQLEPQMKKKAAMSFVYSLLGSLTLVSGLYLSYGLQDISSYSYVYYILFVGVSCLAGIFWWMASRKRADIQKMVQDALYKGGAE